MYDIVKKWSWGNSESAEIYHDPETRKNSISFRSNLSRLSETLIQEGQYDRAEEIIDLAFEKMPIDFYGYYSLWTPFIEGYYKIDRDLKAQDVVKKISLKYSDRLNYYSSLEIFNQYNVGEEIISDIERYRNLIETMLVFDTSEITVEEIKRFISSSEKFNFIYGEFDYYMSVSDFIVSLIKSDELEYSKQIIDKIEDLLIRRVSVFSNLDEDEQIFYIEGITSDINNYSNVINSIELFNRELYENYKKNLDELLKNIVE